MIRPRVVGLAILVVDGAVREDEGDPVLATVVDESFEIIRKMATAPGPLFMHPIMAQGLLGIALVLGLDLFNRLTGYWDAGRARFPAAFQGAYAMLLLFSVVLLGIEKGAQFIYFQF